MFSLSLEEAIDHIAGKEEGEEPQDNRKREPNRREYPPPTDRNGSSKLENRQNEGGN